MTPARRVYPSLPTGVQPVCLHTACVHFPLSSSWRLLAKRMKGPTFCVSQSIKPPFFYLSLPPSLLSLCLFVFFPLSPSLPPLSLFAKAVCLCCWLSRQTMLLPCMRPRLGLPIPGRSREKQSFSFHTHAARDLSSDSLVLPHVYTEWVDGLSSGWMDGQTPTSSPAMWAALSRHMDTDFLPGASD